MACFAGGGHLSFLLGWLIRQTMPGRAPAASPPLCTAPVRGPGAEGGQGLAPLSLPARGHQWRQGSPGHCICGAYPLGGFFVCCLRPGVCRPCRPGCVNPWGTQLGGPTLWARPPGRSLRGVVKWVARVVPWVSPCGDLKQGVARCTCCIGGAWCLEEVPGAALSARLVTCWPR
jgi:hypothetical protein